MSTEPAIGDEVYVCCEFGSLYQGRKGVIESAAEDNGWPDAVNVRINGNLLVFRPSELRLVRS